MNVAGNPSAPAGLLTTLAKDKAVRHVVAENPSTPVDLLKALAKHESQYVRRRVGSNRSTPVGVIRALARDIAKEVRYAVAENPSAPASVLKELARDKNVWVRRALASRERDYMDEHISTSASVLEILAKDRDVDIRRDVAATRSTPARVLKVMAWDEDKEVRSNVAANPSTPPGELELLALEPQINEGDRRTVESAWTSGSKALALRARLLKQLYAGSNPSYARVYGLMLKDCPARVVAKCAKSPLWLERCVVAQHLTTPKKLLQTLVHDTNETVRAAAQWRLERGMQTSDRRAKARAVALSMTRGRSQLARRIPKRHRTVLFKGDPVKIAKVLDRLLEGANGARRAVMSHKTVSSLLRLVISKEQLAWARSHQTKYGSSSATLALCARINKNELCIAIARGSAHNASPGGTWPDLRPWRPALKRTTEKLKDWLGTGSADRARLTMSKATAVASALMKLPPQKIKWHKGGWSDSNEIFVIRDFTQKHVDIDTTDVR